MNLSTSAKYLRQLSATLINGRGTNELGGKQVENPSSLCLAFVTQALTNPPSGWRQKFQISKFPRFRSSLVSPLIGH